MADASLPHDIAWATGKPTVAGAFPGPPLSSTPAPRDRYRTRSGYCCSTYSRDWTGEAPGPNRAWADDAVASLHAADRAAGRLALLTAFASYQLDATVIADFRRIELPRWQSRGFPAEIGHPRTARQKKTRLPPGCEDRTSGAPQGSGPRRRMFLEGVMRMAP